MMNKNAFTMIELVFVIVVLGILAAIAIPKFSATRDDAKISAMRAEVAAVRSGLVGYKQSKMLTGQYNCSGATPSSVLTYGSSHCNASGCSYQIGAITTCNLSYDSSTCKLSYSSGDAGICDF